MGLADWLVISLLCVAAMYPAARSWTMAAVGIFSKKNVASPDAVEQWRQKWTALLITLGREIEGGSGSLTRQAEALRLSRELMWEIIGGEPDQPSPPVQP